MSSQRPRRLGRPLRRLTPYLCPAPNGAGLFPSPDKGNCGKGTSLCRRRSFLCSFSDTVHQEQKHCRQKRRGGKAQKRRADARPFRRRTHHGGQGGAAHVLCKGKRCEQPAARLRQKLVRGGHGAGRKHPHKQPAGDRGGKRGGRGRQRRDEVTAPRQQGG